MDTYHAPTAAHVPLTTTRPSHAGTDPSGPLGVARAIVLVQGAALVALTIEAVIFAAAFGAAAIPGAVVTAIAAVVTLATAAGLDRGARLARKWTIVAEAAVLATGILDLALSVVMTAGPVGPVIILTRLVAPVIVIVLVRRSDRGAASQAAMPVPGTNR